MDIHWIIDYVDKPLRLIWVDDVFFPPDWLKTNQIPLINRGVIEQAVHMNDTDPSAVYDLPYQLQWMLAIRKICQELRVGFAVASFSYCEQKIKEFKTETTLFLCDVQNLATKNENLVQDYGYDFVLNNLQDSWERVKFHTRFWDPAKTLRKFPELDNFGDFRKKNITPDPGEPREYREWIQSFLLHSDPYVCDAIRFYSKPWIEVWPYPWEHDALETRDQRGLKEAAQWLELPVEVLERNNSESLKALLMYGSDDEPWGDWDVEEYDPHHNSRTIQIEVLKAVFRRLNIPFESFFPNYERWVRVPCYPLLPFLVSLRSLFSHMEREGRPPEVIELSGTPLETRGFEFYILSLKLLKEDPNEPDKRDPYGLASSFRQMEFDKNWEVQAHTTTLKLRSLPWCRTLNLRNNLEQEYPFMKLFSRGSKVPVVAIYFSPYFVHLVWTGTLIDQ